MSPVSLGRSLSERTAWDTALREPTVETVAEAFAVVGLPISTPLQPLMECGGDELVLSNLCLVSAAEIKPEGLQVLTDTPNGQRAIISAGGGTNVYLAQCLRPQRRCARPITAICLVDTERGESAPAGFEPVDCTAEAESAKLARTLFVSREVADPRDASPSATPLCRVAVLARHGRGSEPPPNFVRLEGVLGSTKAERVLAFSRAAPSGLLQTPLKATILDSLLHHDRPRATAEEQEWRDAEDGESGDSDSETAAHRLADDLSPLSSGPRARADTMGDGGMRSSYPRELPSALPHFCLPQGAQLRVSCPWPTAHDFALTDSGGARLYGCCLTVWEPLAERALLLLRPTTMD